VFPPQGPSARELARQALSSVEGGYDLLVHRALRPGGIFAFPIAAPPVASRWYWALAGFDLVVLARKGTP
jgi:hypothetical protein